MPAPCPADQIIHRPPLISKDWPGMILLSSLDSSTTALALRQDERVRAIYPRLHDTAEEGRVRVHDGQFNA